MDFKLRPVNDDRQIITPHEQRQPLVLPGASAGHIPMEAGEVQFRKRMTWCKKCKREVQMTEKAAFQAGGRRVLVVACHCHGDKQVIRVCEDDLRENILFELFGPPGEELTVTYKNDPDERRRL